MRETKLPRDMNLDSHRFLQEREDKTFKALNYLSMDNITSSIGGRSHRKIPKLNITINNNNTSLVVNKHS